MLHNRIKKEKYGLKKNRFYKYLKAYVRKINIFKNTNTKP